MITKYRFLTYALIVSASAVWVAPATAEEPHVFHITVSASKQWIGTDVILAEGDHVAIQASGEVTTTVEGAPSGPNGQSYHCNPSCTFPDGQFGQLIGKIGTDGRPLAIGERETFLSEASGELFLGVNDCCDWNDNRTSRIFHNHQKR